MDAKLTLKLKHSVIKRAKNYAKSHRTSLSTLIENYLVNITDEEENNQEKITPLVKSLSGVIDLDRSYDHKKNYSDFLINKYRTIFKK